jgi:aldose 1-epimerase
MDISEERFGKTKDGKDVIRLSISNSNNLSISVISYGATLTRVQVPDRKGATANVVLGFDTVADYETKSPYFGALVGRFANRIGGGRFQLDGKEYQLACNDIYGAGAEEAANHLHGGNVGYDKVLWKMEQFRQAAEAGVEVSYVSPDGEEGYPGTLGIRARYTLNEDNLLSFEYWAETDKPTPVNLTNHAYWNLAGAGSGDVLGHQLTLHCPYYIVVDESLIPTGEIRPVAGTPMDFTTAKPIGRDLDKVPGGYDHCFAAESTGGKMKPIASLYEPGSGRKMEVSTTKPGVQFYGGNFLDGIKGAGGAIFNKYGALCLETEHYPDAVNHADFPDCVLRPGQTYHHKTVHTFSVE